MPCCDFCKNALKNYSLHITSHYHMSGWPSGLRRQTQEQSYQSILVHNCGRGFESHFWQKQFCIRRLAAQQLEPKINKQATFWLVTGNSRGWREGGGRDCRELWPQYLFITRSQVTHAFFIFRGPTMIYFHSHLQYLSEKWFKAGKMNQELVLLLFWLSL